MTVGSEMSVSAFTTSTTASGTTAFFMQAMLKPYTSSQNAMRSWCFCVSPTAARLMLQRSGYTVEKTEERRVTRTVHNIRKQQVQHYHYCSHCFTSQPQVFTFNFQREKTDNISCLSTPDRDQPRPDQDNHLGEFTLRM